MSTKICLIFITLALCCGSSFAADYVGMGKINMMQNAYNGWIVKTTGLALNPSMCSKNVIMLDGNHPQYKEIYSFLLTAYTAAKDVNITVDGCDANGYKKLTMVYSTWNN